MSHRELSTLLDSPPSESSRLPVAKTRAKKFYTEVRIPYLFDDSDGGATPGIIGGFVQLPDGIVTSFIAEDDAGQPRKIPTQFMCQAISDLVESAQDIWSRA